MPPQPLTILVTAVGGDLGQALVKALRIAALPCRVLGADTGDRHSGVAFVERLLRLPPASDPDYLAALDGWCRQYAVAAVVPGCEPEIRRLMDLPGLALPGGARVVCLPGPVFEAFGDKLVCYRRLEHEVPLAAFADGRDRLAVDALARRYGFPLVVKERRASGSRGLLLAPDRERLDLALALVAEPVVQEFLDDAGGEFSVGVFRAGAREAALAFRRQLGPGGASWFAATVADAEVTDYALRVARVVPCAGSLNVQVRRSRNGVRLLEVNPRFSSLVAARAAAGFTDAEWSVRLALGLPLDWPPRTRSLAFARVMDEMLDLGDGFRMVREWLPGSPPVSLKQNAERREAT